MTTWSHTYDMPSPSKTPIHLSSMLPSPALHAPADNCILQQPWLTLPFLDRYNVLHWIKQQTCSASPVSYCVDPDLVLRETAYYNNTKSHAYRVAPMLSAEPLYTLLHLTWEKYEMDHDNMFWMHSRMAITLILGLAAPVGPPNRQGGTRHARPRHRLEPLQVQHRSHTHTHPCECHSHMSCH